MTIYFKQFNSTGGYWVAPAYVVNSKGEVINGTLNLSDLDLSVLGTSKTPSNMQPYIAAYTSSIHWLAAFVPKPGQPLSSAYWGKIASIGGSPIAPGASAKVTVPAGTFDTKVITYHKGVDNNIWISPQSSLSCQSTNLCRCNNRNPSHPICIRSSSSRSRSASNTKEPNCNSQAALNHTNSTRNILHTITLGSTDNSCWKANGFRDPF